MPRILAIDYGGKRTGIAVTDPDQLIATGLTTLPTQELIPFLLNYISTEPVEKIIIGMPVNWDGTDTHATPLVRKAIKQIRHRLPKIPLEPVDERFTSSLAKQAMLDMGMKKKDRRVKGNVDVIAAAILLQEYLQER